MPTLSCFFAINRLPWGLNHRNRQGDSWGTIDWSPWESMAIIMVSYNCHGLLQMPVGSHDDSHGFPSVAIGCLGFPWQPLKHPIQSHGNTSESMAPTLVGLAARYCRSTEEERRGRAEGRLSHRNACLAPTLPVGLGGCHSDGASWKTEASVG